MKKCCDENTELEDLCVKLKNTGLSMTQTKIELFEIFLNSSIPLSSLDISNMIPHVNESTIFRNLKQLTQINILTQVNLGEGFKRYELSPSGHHHHFIKCINCGKIDSIGDCNLSLFQKQIQKLGYRNISHRIEFSGMCQTC